MLPIYRRAFGPFGDVKTDHTRSPEPVALLPRLAELTEGEMRVR